MKNVPLLPARLDWPSAIGSFLMNFGTLESMVFTYLKNNLADAEYARVRGWHLKDRLTRMREHLSTSDAKAEKLREFDEACKRFDRVRELRNHLAHGHICSALDPDTGEAYVAILKTKDAEYELHRGTERLHFEALQSGMMEVDHLTTYFSRLAGFGGGSERDDRAVFEIIDQLQW